MSSLAPSTWDPKKDQDRIDQLKKLAGSVDAKNEWEGVGKTMANELFTILDEGYVVSKNSATIKELEKLKVIIQKREDTLITGSNDILENSKYIVLQNDIALIQERIDLLQAIGNPKEEFLVDDGGVFDLKTVYRDAVGSSLDGVKIDPKSVWWGGDKVTVKNLKDNLGIEVTGRKGTVQIIKNDQGVLVIDPIELVDSRLSFSIIGRYTKEGINHGIDVRRKFVVDQLKNNKQSTVDSLKEQLAEDEETGFEKYPEVVADFAKKHGFTPEDLASLDEKELKELEERLNWKFPDDSFKEQNEKMCVKHMELWLKLKGKGKTATVSTPPSQPSPPSSPPSSPPLLLPPPAPTNTPAQQGLTKQKANIGPKKVTISDTRNLFQERALHQADEALRKEYEALGKIGLVSNWRVKDRLKLYLSRELKRGRYMRGYLNQYKQTGADLLNPEMTAAADRHEKMMEHRQEGDHVKHKMQMTAHAVENPAINDLCKRYLSEQPAMQDNVFEQEFQRIASNIPEIRRGLGGNFSFAAGNILLDLRGERSYRRLVLQLRTLSETYFSNRDANAYRTQALQYVRTYVQESKRDIPENIRILMDAPEKVDETKEWFQHEMGRLAVEAGNIRRAIDVIRGGKGAYEVHNTDRNQNPLAVLGGWLKNHPYISVGLTGGSVIAGLLSGHVIIPTAWMGIKYVARKLGDMTLEQKGAENRSVRGLENERARYERLQEMYANPGDYADNRLQERRIKYDARRQLRLFGGTTHREAMSDIEVTIQSVQDAIASGQDLQPRLADALSRLDSYQHTGHNFLAQQHDLKMEENMNTLQNLVIAGARTLGVSLDAIRGTEGYTAIHTDLSQQYESSLQEFKKQRLYLGIQHAVFYTATAMGLRALLGGWSTSNVNSDLNPNIVDGFSLTDAQTAIVEQKIHDLGPGVTHDKLRTIIFEEKMKDGMKMAEFTTLKNEFMSNFALQMQEHGATELIENAKNLSLNTSDSGYNKAMAFLTQPHIGICTPADGPSIVAELLKVKADPKHVFDMSADMRRMCAEYCYCFLDGSNTPAGLLGASFHDQKLRLPLITGSLGLPIFSNTFLRDVQGERRAVPIPPPATPQNPTPRNELPPVSRFDPIVTDPRKQHSLDDGIIDPSAAAGYVQP